MKKKIITSCSAVMFLTVGFFSFAPSIAFANMLEDGVGKKGAYNVREQTDECSSGVKHWCHGDGTVCNITSEWDCE